MANTVYSSPGVYTTEKDLTFTTEVVGVTTLGLVGETQKGPAMQPIFIRNYDEFKITFGGTNPEKFRDSQIVKYELPYIAKSYLTQSNQLLVTRVLGLSGYDAGMAYSIRTLGTCDKETLQYTGDTYSFEFVVDLSSTTSGFTLTGSTKEVSQHIVDLTGVDFSKFDTTYNQFFNKTNFTTRDWYLSNIMWWGIINRDEREAIISDRNNSELIAGAPETPVLIDAYKLPQDIPLSDREDDILIKEFVFDELDDTYSGASFALFVSDIVSTSPTQYTGKITLYLYESTCLPNQEYHKKAVATLRSRGEYISNELVHYVENNIGFQNFEEAATNPFADFVIQGKTINDVDFSYNVSLDRNKTNYIKNVLGSSAFDKDPFIFVEEVYDSVLTKGWTFNKIKGLHYSLVKVNNWSHYEFQFQSPTTPFFVSELRGGIPQRLFRLISISDGSNANTEIKVSIANVNLDRRTFDVLIRDFNDSDRNPVFLERYLSVSMDETKDNFIGRRIGTIDNKYQLRSSYVVVEIAENAPKDGVACGFEGYEFRTFEDNETIENFVGVPTMPYKTKYYAPGETIVNPPFSLPLISNGDNIRKVYLGFTDREYGFDADLLAFKGKLSLSGGDNPYNEGQDWSTKTKGFHMDVNSATIVNSQGDFVFEAGAGTFTDANVIALDTAHPYHDARKRKFTALLSGGFDGWDIYREIRTHGDDYKIGKQGFVAGKFDIFESSEYNETFGTSDYYAFLYGIKSMENPEQTVINILGTPGIDIINNTDLVRDTIEIVEEKRMDTIYLPTLPDIKLIGNSNPGNTEDWLYPNDIITELENTEIDSNYTAVYYPWIQISDVENNANLFIPPTAEVVRNLAFTDNVAHPWFATAGYNRGIVNCIRARIVLDQESRDLLYPARINPIATFSDVGNVIWGNRNLQVRDSALNRLNIRRLLLQARRLIVSVANRLLFDPNDAQVRNQFLSLVNPILDNIRRERGLTDFRVSLVNDVEDTDRNTLRGKIFIKPTPTLEFIQLEFVVTPTSVSFENV
jgi:hypothetical protein